MCFITLSWQAQIYKLQLCPLSVFAAFPLSLIDLLLQSEKRLGLEMPPPPPTKIPSFSFPLGYGSSPIIALPKQPLRRKWSTACFNTNQLRDPNVCKYRVGLKGFQGFEFPSAAPLPSTVCLTAFHCLPHCNFRKNWQKISQPRKSLLV